MASQEMENLKKIMQKMMASGFAPKFDGSADPMQLRKVVNTAQKNMPPEPGVTYEAETLGGIEAETSVPEGVKDDYLIIYMHGGGLICGDAFSSRGYAGVLAAETKHPVISFTYRLAPENKFPAMVDDSVAVYKAVVEKYPNKPIFLIGESGGAYLCIATTMRARDEGVKLPAGIVPYSPPIEFCGILDRNFEGNEDFTVKPDSIPWLRDLIVGDDLDTAKNNKYINFTLDDFHDFCPVMLAYDQNETLAVDSLWLEETLKKAGADVESYSYPHCFHAFATAGRGTEESRDIVKHTIEFFEKHA